MNSILSPPPSIDYDPPTTPAQLESEVLESESAPIKMTCPACLHKSAAQSSDSGKPSTWTDPLGSGPGRCADSYEGDFIDVEKVDDADTLVNEVVINQGKARSALKGIVAHTCSFCGEYFMNVDPFNEHMMSHFYPNTPSPPSSSKDEERPLQMVNRNFFKKNRNQYDRQKLAFGRHHFERKALLVGKKPGNVPVIKKRSHRSRGVHVYPPSGTELDLIKAELQLATFQCLDCGTEFVTSRSLRSHMESNNHVTSVMSRRFETPERLRCLRCDKDFVTVSALLDHSREIHSMNV